MLGLFQSILVFLSLILALSVARPPPRTPSLTNAERFKRGLPPRAPSKLYNPAKRLPSNDVAVQRLGSRAALPATIKVYDNTNPSSPAFLGYLTEGGGVFGYGSLSDAKVLLVDLSTLNPGNIGIQYAEYPYLGFAGPYQDIGSGSANIAYLATVDNPTAVNQTSLSSPDQSFAPGQSEPTETTVWYLTDPSTLEIKPQWINEDGGRPATHLAYFTQLNYIIITGDPGYLPVFFGSYAANIVISFRLDTVDLPPI